MVVVRKIAHASLSTRLCQPVISHITEGNTATVTINATNGGGGGNTALVANNDSYTGDSATVLTLTTCVGEGMPC